LNLFSPTVGASTVSVDFQREFLGEAQNVSAMIIISDVSKYVKGFLGPWGKE
jgi:hypothetical protein